MDIVQLTEDEKQDRRFTTYLNYLSFISKYLDHNYSDKKQMVLPIVNSNKFKCIVARRNIDLEKVGALLRNAWSTEAQISILKAMPDYLQYTNHWTPIQAYYSIYLCLRAYIFILNPQISGKHERNLSEIGEEIRRRPDLFPLPWKVLCINTHGNDLYSFVNLPQSTRISTINPLQYPNISDFWNSYAMFLETTRDRQILGLCADWKKQNKKKRIGKIARHNLGCNLSPTTLFHALYRLRIRSNYLDADSFWIIEPSQQKVVSFYNAISSITWNTMLIIELLIARHIGKKEFANIISRIRKRDPLHITEELVQSRWEIINNMW